MTRRGIAGLVAVALVVGLLGACRTGDRPPTTPSATAPTTPPFEPVDGQVVVATGDVVCSPAQRFAAQGRERQCQNEQTAAVAKSLSPDAVLLAGDIQYERGSEAEFQAYQVSAWSSLKSITYPAPGNHEYSTPGAAPYYATFGGRAGPAGRGWYSVDIGDWHVIALNSNCRPAGGCGEGSPQARWLRDDLAASKRKCTLAFFHHPRWSSGYHGSDESLEPLWAVLADAGADVAVAGHDHHYERFAPERGLRQFVAGTGGRSLYPTLGALSGSEVRNSDTFGVLELRLGAGEYSWRFHGIPGTTFTDFGRATCA